MGILKNLLVLGSAKFVNKIQGNITGDAGTVNSHTVEKDVPSNAVFTDTPSIYFGHCATAAATSDKVVELDEPTGFTLRNGVMICVSFDATNTASNVTLNVEGTGAKAVSQVEDTAYTGTSNTITGHTSYYTYYVYNGTYWCFVNYSANTTNNANTVPSAQCETAAGTAAKASTCTNYSLKANSYLHVNLRYANTASSALTFNVNSKGAKPLYINGEPSSASNKTLPAGSYIAFYDGTNWYFRTDDKLPANIDGDSDTVDGFNFGVVDDQNIQVGWDGDAPEIVIPTSTALPIASGGTGATTAAAARTNLGLGSAATYNVVSSVNNDSNLVTGAAIKTYYEAVGVPSAISTTTAATAAKTATCSSYSLLANSYIQVIIAIANTASSALTLNINGKGAKPIFINGTVSSSTNKTLPAGSYFVYYDGTNYYFRTDGKMTGDITGDSVTVNGHSVNKDVPSNAAFTDTTALGSMTGTLTVSHGGTGATTLASGEALIGNGTGAVTTRAIRNNTTVGSIGWSSAESSIQLLTQNDIAWWNGRYNGASSNLKYCIKGEFKEAVTYDVETAVANDSKLPTGAAVKTYVDGKVVKSKTVSGTTTASGALNTELDINSYAILGARCTTTTGKFAFIRGDGYLTVFQVSNNAMVVLANTAVTFEVYYCAI